jgi:hypothetical protein
MESKPPPPRADVRDIPRAPPLPQFRDNLSAPSYAPGRIEEHDILKSKSLLPQNAGRYSEMPTTMDVVEPGRPRRPIRGRSLPRSVLMVCLAGEPLSTRLVDDLYATGHVERVFDLYGPSEDTTYSTFALREPQAPATIGRPIANTRAYVLDTQLEPMPIGVVGGSIGR